MVAVYHAIRGTTWQVEHVGRVMIQMQIQIVTLEVLMDLVYNAREGTLWQAMVTAELQIPYVKPSTIQMEIVFLAIVGILYKIRLVLLATEMQIQIVLRFLLKVDVCNATQDFIFLHRFVNRLINFAKQRIIRMAIV